MKKVFRLKNLDCANCANKMERAVMKIDGVKSVSVNFLLQKMAVEAEDTKFERVIEQTKTVCRRIEPDCELE